MSDGCKFCLDVESAHSCKKACVAMKTPQSHACGHQGLEEFRGRALTCCACTLRQAAVLKRGRVMAVRRRKGGRGSQLQLRRETWHGYGAASGKQRNPMP